MAADERNQGKTDLIDVGEIATEFDDEFTSDAGEATAQAEQTDTGGPTIAEPRDRFAAFFIDASLLYVLYWLLMLPYRAIAMGAMAGPVPLSGANGLIFNGIFLLLAFLWFTIPEFAFGASVGKLLCHLSVRRTDGNPPNILSAVLRNLVRPFDILLSPILVPMACMEWTMWNRRLGDLAGGTLVIKHLGRAPKQFALSMDMLAGTTRRGIAFLIDVVIFGAFAAGYLMLLNPRSPVASMLLTVFAPFFFLAFFTLPEWLTHTSPGKWIMGMSVCHEDGTAGTLATALIRNFWRIFDTNPFGFLTSYMGARKQRPGDQAAGSLVIKVSREWRGIVALVASILVSAIAVYAGLQNRDNFLSGDFEVNFLPSLDTRGGARSVEEIQSLNLGIRNFRFAAGDPDTVRKPPIFQPGETLYMVFEVGGYKVERGGVWIQEDLSVMYPDGSLGLRLENINDFKQELAQKGLIRFENNIALPQRSQPGRYTVTITLRDKFARREIKEQRFFYITPPEDNRAPAGRIETER